MPYKDPEKRREWERGRSEKRRKYRQEHPEAGFKTAMSVWKNNPTRAHARQVVYHALKAGVITKAKHCECCGKDGCVLQAHHDSYEDPLSITWLCISCHKQADRKRQRKSGESPANGRKLTDEQVVRIRTSDKTNRELAAIYGISSCSVSKIKNYLTYKDVR